MTETIVKHNTYTTDNRPYVDAEPDTHTEIPKDTDIRFPEADKNGVIGVIELGGSVYDDVHESLRDQHDSATSMLLMVEPQVILGSELRGMLQDVDPALLNERVLIIDVKALELNEKGKVAKGMAYVGPHNAMSHLGRDIDWHEKAFSLHSAALVSRTHLEFGMQDGRIHAKDISTNGSTYCTGSKAYEALEKLHERHEHAKRILAVLLGKSAAEGAVDGSYVPIDPAVTEEPREVAEVILATGESGTQEPTSPAVSSSPSDIERVQSSRITLELAARNRKAAENIVSLLGESGMGGGTLGERLRELAGSSDPAMIRELLGSMHPKGDIANEPTARKELVGQLRMKLEALLNGENRNSWPSRVRDNDAHKKPENAPLDYPVDEDGHIASHEYVARLALAMLDGSYDDKKAVWHGDRDDIAVDQHRKAAIKLLAEIGKEQPVAEPIPQAEIDGLNEVDQKILKDIRVAIDQQNIQLRIAQGNLTELHDAIVRDMVQIDYLLEVYNTLTRSLYEAEQIATKSSTQMNSLQSHYTAGTSQGIEVEELGSRMSGRNNALSMVTSGTEYRSLLDGMTQLQNNQYDRAVLADVRARLRLHYETLFQQIQAIQRM